LSPFETDVASLHASSFGWALACCGRDADEAAEVLQQVYFKVFSGKARFDGRSSLRTWLFGVIRLTALEARRFRLPRWFRGGQVRNDVAPEEHASDEPSPSASLEDRRRAEAIAEALTSLPPRQREVLHLTFYEGLTLREAAAIMEISLGSASQHYERGKARLLALLTTKGIP